MNRVTLALAEDLKAHGGEIRTNVRVHKILGDAKCATAVRLTSGEEIPVGQLVVSNVDPRPPHSGAARRWDGRTRNRREGEAIRVGRFGLRHVRGAR